MSKNKLYDLPVYGVLTISGWHGQTGIRILVLGETLKKFRIRAITKTKLSGRGRYLEPGQTTLVPKAAVVIENISYFSE